MFALGSKARERVGYFLLVLVCASLVLTAGDELTRLPQCCLSEELGASETANVLHCFYDQCATSIWERDGIINKFIGDAVLAIFNFPIMREDHVRQGTLSAIALQKACAE